MTRKSLSKTQLLVELSGAGPIRARDLATAHIPRSYLRRLCDQGVLERVDRGIYRLAEGAESELHILAQVGKRVPHGIVCLLSALQLHGLTVEVPRAVWLMIDRSARTPKVGYPALEIVRGSGLARSYGVESRVIEGVTVQVTSAAKTVADCFRYRRRVGLDTALQALRDYLRRRPGRNAYQYSIEALLAAARADRAHNVIRPYLEALA